MYSRIIPTKSPLFCMTTVSASLTNLTTLLRQSHDCSCYVSRRTLAPPPLWLQKHTDLCAHEFVHSFDLWHEPRLANVTSAWSWRPYGIGPAIHWCPRTCCIMWIRGRLRLKCDRTRWRTGVEVTGKLANGVDSPSPTHRFTLPRNLVYPVMLPLMRTSRLPGVDWTDAPADLNGLVLFDERRNLISAPMPSHFKGSLQQYCKKPMSGFSTGFIVALCFGNLQAK